MGTNQKFEIRKIKNFGLGRFPKKMAIHGEQCLLCRSALVNESTKLERIRSNHFPTVLSSYEPKFMYYTCSEPCEITLKKLQMATTRRPFVQFQRIFLSSTINYRSFPQNIVDVPQLHAESAKALCLLT